MKLKTGKKLLINGIILVIVSKVVHYLIGGLIGSTISLGLDIVSLPFIVIGIFRIIKEKKFKKRIIKNKSNKIMDGVIYLNFLIIAVFLIIMAGILFYWFAIRTMNIRKECSLIEVRQDSRIWKKGQLRSVSDNKYKHCLREHGLKADDVSDKRTIKDKTYINEEAKQVQKDSLPPNYSQNLEDALNKINQADEVNCQKEIVEYNTCLNEYNSKIAEYNACLNANLDPQYRLFCSKPLNYCFKPLCSY